MARITIELEQARKRLYRPEGRLFMFPDGIERVIALPRRNWEMYDRLRREWVYVGLCETKAYAMAMEECGDAGRPHFEATLRELFAMSIEAGWSVLNEARMGGANENL